MGASTPHFALQLRNRIRTLIARLPGRPPRPDRGRARDPRLDEIALGSERRGPDPGARTRTSQLPRSGVSWAHGLGVQPPGRGERHRGSDELIDCLRDRAEQGACRFTLVMPAHRRRGARAARGRARAACAPPGSTTSRASVGDPDPVVAVMDVWDPMKFDEVIVSTLPTGSSRWLGLDLPHRLEKLTSVPVRHVVSQPRARGGAGGPAAEAASALRGARRPRRADHEALATRCDRARRARRRSRRRGRAARAP